MRLGARLGNHRAVALMYAVKKAQSRNGGAFAAKIQVVDDQQFGFSFV